MAKYLINRSYQIARDELIGEHCHMFGEIKPTRSMRPEEIITEMVQIINERRSEINEIKSRKS